MSIIIDMNIYITDENEINLRNLNGSMSGLINELLAEYFNKQPTATKIYPDEPTSLTATELELKAMKKLPVDIASKIKPHRKVNSYSAEELSNMGETITIPNIRNLGTNLCKIHGTPLTGFGKCLMKGCKYA